MLDGENKLIARAKNKDKKAFGILYDYYQPKIYRFIFIKTGSKEDSEDLTHQVFLSAWQKIEEYEERGFPFSGWLYQIARNAVIDFYRSKRHNVQLEEVENILPDNSYIEEDIDLKIKLEKLMNAIKQLKTDYQDVVIMRFVDDLSVREVANILNKSEGSIKLMQHRAIKKLKEIFEK
jgi:RNA polymerase sigma-70 factor (ECF subfamily)